MTTLVKPALLAALIVPGIALAGAEVGQTLGTTEAEVRAALESQGYAVLEIELEEDEIEAEVTLDGVAYEIEVAGATGLITEIEAEDDAEDDDS